MANNNRPLNYQEQVQALRNERRLQRYHELRDQHDTAMGTRLDIEKQFTDPTLNEAQREYLKEEWNNADEEAVTAAGQIELEFPEMVAPSPEEKGQQRVFNRNAAFVARNGNRGVAVMDDIHNHLTQRGLGGRVFRPGTPQYDHWFKQALGVYGNMGGLSYDKRKHSANAKRSVPHRGRES